MTQATAVIATNLVKPEHYPTPTLENRLQAALEHARRLTAMFGLANPEVALAWETVEELQAEKARQQAAKKAPVAPGCMFDIFSKIFAPQYVGTGMKGRLYRAYSVKHPKY